MIEENDKQGNNMMIPQEKMQALKILLEDILGERIDYKIIKDIPDGEESASKRFVQLEDNIPADGGIRYQIQARFASDAIDVIQHITEFDGNAMEPVKCYTQHINLGESDLQALFWAYLEWLNS